MRRQSGGRRVAPVITIRTNISQVFQKLQADLNKLKDREYLLRPVATEIIPMITERIHQKGQASDNSQIGTYSNSYLKFRAENKRGKDTKVIVSLTRQLENDWSVVATPKGYGIGFLNSFNAKKLKWVEERKSKVISRLSPEETEYAIDRINELVNAAINS